jgi:hypothetical protein
MGVGEIARIDQDEEKLDHPSLPRLFLMTYFFFKGGLVDPLLRALNEHFSIRLLPSLLVSHSPGMAPVLVPLRPSSEALLRARAPGAGDQRGCRSTPLLFHRHHHRNWLQRIVEFVARGGDDLVHHLHSPKDLTEDGVGSIQSTGVRDTDIELRAVIVGVPRAVALARDLGHADRAAFMRTIARFRVQPVTRTARPVQGTVWILAQRIAALNDESWNDAMEGGSIVEPHLGELEKVLDVTRSVVRIEPNLDLAERCRDGDARIDFLKLHSHDANVARAFRRRQGLRRSSEC